LHVAWAKSGDVTAVLPATRATPATRINIEAFIDTPRKSVECDRQSPVARKMG
jgi:hypothetical protein